MTSRPLILSSIGRLDFRGGQTHLPVTPMRAKAVKATVLLTAVKK